MGRWSRFVALLLIALVVSGCAAGAPVTLAPPTTTVAELSGIEATKPPPPTPVPPTVAPRSTITPPTTAAPPPTPTAPPAPAAGDAAETGGALAFQGTRPAPPADPGETLQVEGGPNDRLEVALTFDAGADTGYAAAILDLLRDEGIAATFGMTGLWAEANPDLVRRMVAEGHQLINHTWSHNSLIGIGSRTEPMSYEALLDELTRTEDLVRDLTGYQMKPYFRAPYGEWDAERLGYLHDAGYYLNVYWTCDSRGWAGWAAAEIVAYCTTNLKPDEIILLHVGASAAGDYESLPAMISSFREQGYDFVTVEQMLQA